jgi:hypothetical protein
LIEVELGDLKKVGKEIAESLNQRMKTEVQLKGKLILIPDEIGGKKVSVKDAKMQVKHVLHHLSFSGEYRVLTEQHKIKIVRVEEKARPAQEKGTPPPAPQSLPYFFP